MLLYIMKILKNLLGDHSKIHADSIYFESGSNDDGHWMKFPNGWQICHSSGPYDMTGNTLENPITINFPIAFKEVKSLQHSLNRITFDFAGRLISRATVPSLTLFRHAHEGASTSTIYGSYLAFGRYK